MNYTYSIILGISLLIIVLYYYKKYYKSIKGFEDGVTLFRHCNKNDEIKHGFSTQRKIYKLPLQLIYLILLIRIDKLYFV